MRRCTLKNIFDVKPPRQPSIEDILETARKVLRKRELELADLYQREDLLYWVSMFLGFSKIPVGDCEKERFSLEELGYYDLVEYDNYHVAKEPWEIVFAAKPTPLVKLRVFNRRVPRIWAKLEWYNPFSLSIKDRVARQMMYLAVKTGLLDEGRGIVEASSSNTGIALAALSAILGMRAKILIPRFAPIENENILRLLGADVERMEFGVTTEILDQVQEYVASENLFNPDQFHNDANLLAHMRYTARELLLQLEYVGVKPDAAILPSGTSGTASATSFVLSNYYGDIDVFVVTPAKDEVIEGIRRLETGVKWLDKVGVNYNVIEVTRREAIEGIKIAARLNGIVPGVSGGALIAAIRKLWKEREGDPGYRDIVTVIPDTGFKYPKAIGAALDDA
ncbi:MAG: pyridoxal-phosphate dependent enzyme [Desulfurococcales archaeon]|nr:pyridoxal-phosphate dependent enzyme [Desulfurococcales archaeon]